MVKFVVPCGLNPGFARQPITLQSAEINPQAYREEVFLIVTLKTLLKVYI